MCIAAKCGKARANPCIICSDSLCQGTHTKAGSFYVVHVDYSSLSVLAIKNIINTLECNSYKCVTICNSVIFLYLMNINS